MVFTTFEPCHIDEHDVDLLVYDDRPTADTRSANAIRQQRKRIKANGKLAELTDRWLNEYFSDHESELTVRDIVPVLVRYPRILGEVTLHVKAANGTEA